MTNEHKNLTSANTSVSSNGSCLVRQTAYLLFRFYLQRFYIIVWNINYFQLTSNLDYYFHETQTISPRINNSRVISRYSNEIEQNISKFQLFGIYQNDWSLCKILSRSIIHEKQTYVVEPLHHIQTGFISAFTKYYSIPWSRYNNIKITRNI